VKKNNYLIIAVFVIIAAVYNIVVFSVGGEHAAAFWSAYGFTMFAVVAAAITYALAFKDGKDAAFLNIPVTIVATAYFFVQLLFGIILMAIPNLSIVFANVAQIIVLAIFLIIVIGGLMGKNVTVDSEREVREKKFYIKSLSADLERLIEKASDAAHKKALTDLYEVIRYSDPMSHPSLDDLEQKIAAKVSALADNVNGGNVEGIAEKCTEIERLVADRNRKCKILK